MKFRRLGNTDLTVSEVGFGVWSVSTGWWGPVGLDEGTTLLQRALDTGINFFDTADTYGDGLGEEMVGQALSAHRHEIVLATKVGYDFYAYQVRQGHRERPQNFSPEYIRSACEKSLRRLRTDYVDLYQLHNPRLEVIRQDEVIGTLSQLIEEGKIRHAGVALGPDIGWFEEGEASMRDRKVPSLQIIYSILEQQPARRFFPLAREHGTGLLARVPHASEVLTERFRKTPPVFQQGDHRSHRRKEWLEEAVRKVDALDFLLSHHEMTLDQMAIKFCLTETTIASVLPNITNLEELSLYSSAPDMEDVCQECIARLFQLYDRGFRTEDTAPEAAPSS
ncbi:MAG: aldo/keto reductase [Chloroflexi bacterium]|nr:aldo/keto reductase [Chloroflexota bacterium]